MRRGFASWDDEITEEEVGLAMRAYRALRVGYRVRMPYPGQLWVGIKEVPIEEWEAMAATEAEKLLTPDREYV